MNARKFFAATAGIAALVLGYNYGRSTLDEGYPVEEQFYVCAKDGVTVAHFYGGGDVFCGDGWVLVSIGGTSAGSDGVNGVDGVNGADGTNGVNGADGADGVDGADGADAGDVALSLWFRDSDGDGYGHAALADLIVGGPQPTGYVGNLTDCDDTRATVHPGATEIEGDGIDQDCDGVDPVPATPGNAASTEPSVSEDGRYVAFTSYATNLVAGTTTSGSQVFVRDTVTGVTSVVSVSSAGVLAGGTSRQPSISDDGRYVAFTSNATNLVSGHIGTHDDVYVRDRVAGTTVLVTPRGSESAAYSWHPEISGDESVVVFDSTSSTLVAGDVNGRVDSFRWVRADGSLTLASVSTTGVQGNANAETPSVSGDGLFVSFNSGSTTLVTEDTAGTTNVFMRDVAASTTSIVSLLPSSAPSFYGSYEPSVSGDGRYVAFTSSDELVAGDENRLDDIYVRDRLTSTTWRASFSTDGTEGNGNATHASLAANGQVVAFDSTGSTFVSGDTNGVSDVFVSDHAAGTIVRVSVSSAGAQGNVQSHGPSISADGRYVAYYSAATNLVMGDTNGAYDVFLYDLVTGHTLLVSAAAS